jgi:hypothetical protein
MAKRTEKFSEQISVIVVPAARRYLENEAALNCRSLAGQVRFMLEEAARRAGAQNGKPAPSPWPPPLTEPGESIETTRARYTALIEERDTLVARQRKERMMFSLENEERLRTVHQHIEALAPAIRLADRMERSP